MTDLSAMPRARLFTIFGTVLYVDVVSGQLRHGPIDASPANTVLVCDPLRGRIMHDREGSLAPVACAAERCRTLGSVEAIDVPAAPTLLEIVGLDRRLVGLKAEGVFLCAEPDGRITLSRAECRDWESFRVENVGGKDRGRVSWGFESTTEIQRIFTEIYQRNGFLGGESISGPGSSLDSTGKLRSHLPEVLRSFGIKRMVDAPCGDMNWMRRVEYDFDFLIGVDIVEDLIERLRSQFPSERYHFQIGDICGDILPKADAIFCRDFFVHLPFSNITEAIRLFKLSGAKFLLTTTFPEKENRDLIVAGPWRPINLEKAPFSWPDPMRLLREAPHNGADPWNDKSLGVWPLLSLPD